MTAAEVLEALRSRGDVWDVAPGLSGLRGATAQLHRSLAVQVAGLCYAETRDAWIVPPALPLTTLAAAQYFDSFPQWLTLAAHLRDDPAALRSIAESPAPAAAVAAAPVSDTVALTPAVCYHVYAALSGQRLTAPRVVTAEGTCWRHEGATHRTLERGWAFTMREVVCVGDEPAVREFVDRALERTRRFAESLGLTPTIVAASDPFFAPTARGKQLLQMIKGLKREMVLPLGDGSETAAASFNLHETRFGEAFDIRSTSGGPAYSGCVAFGVERWVLAILARHGLDPAHWPAALTTHFHDGALP